MSSRNLNNIYIRNKKHMIPFSPPRIDQIIIDEVTEVLKSGWITTGPRTKALEKKITNYCGNKTTVCVSSWTMGMQILLDWWGIGEGDEVIVPAYTYCATGNVVLHNGAKLVMVDCAKNSFNLDIGKLEMLINKNTKAIIPVDIAGLPCDYKGIIKIVNSKKDLFQPNNDLQKKMGRIAVFADAAHSFGAMSGSKFSGSLADITVFSFHAVKNLTTAEGGAIAFNLPDNFNHDEIYKHFCVRILHGQSKDALAKTKKGAWRYDVEFPGFKCNMTDLQAAIGLIEIDRYKENLAKRKAIFKQYDELLDNKELFETPFYEDKSLKSSYHLYTLRIKGATEKQRDLIIEKMAQKDISVNVHFQPLPLLSAYKERGFDIENFPNAFEQYKNEISLPVFYTMTEQQVQEVASEINKVTKAIMQDG